MTLQQFKYALAVQEEMSFVKAAEKCRVAQPSLSTQIKILESSFGVILFNRSANSKVTVTPQGKMILDRLRILLSDLQLLIDDAKSIDSQPVGILKVGLIPTICPYLMPYLLKFKNKLYPDLQLEIIEDTTDRLIDLLDQGKIDCGILSTPQKAPENLIEKFLYYEPFVLYASAEHPLLNKQNVDSNDLSKFEVSMLDETHCMRDQVLAACHMNKKNKAMNSQSKLVTGSLQTLVSIVDETKSYSLIPQLAAESLHFKHPKSGLRKIVNPIPQRKVSLVYNKSYGRKTLINAVIDSIQKGLPDNVYTQPHKSAVILDPAKSRFE